MNTKRLYQSTFVFSSNKGLLTLDGGSSRRNRRHVLQDGAEAPTAVQCPGQGQSTPWELVQPRTDAAPEPSPGEPKQAETVVAEVEVREEAGEENQAVAVEEEGEETECPRTKWGLGGRGHERPWWCVFAARVC